MPEIEESVNKTEVSQQGDTQVVRKSTSTASSAGTQGIVINGIWLVLGILEVILIFRFVLRLLGANSATGFVSLVYSVSKVFVAPFSGIFTSPTTQGNIATSVFETATLVALVVYALVFWGIVKLVSLNKNTPQ